MLKLSKEEKEKDLWVLLWFDILVAIAGLMVIAFNWSIIHSSPLKVTAGILPFLFIILHAVWVLGLRRGLSFILLAALLGFGFEATGLQTGKIFGNYVYLMDTPAVLGVPFLAILYWSIFIYVGYSITTSFLYWSDRSKPSIHNHNRLTLAGLIVADGLVVTAIDLFMDPLQVKLGSWIWLDAGPYFGVPLQNFIGWFIVTVTITGLFRVFEYYHPRRLAVIPKTVFLIPLVAYIGFAMCFITLALIFHMTGLAIIGSTLMLAVAVWNLACYEKRALQRHHRQPVY